MPAQLLRYLLADTGTLHSLAYARPRRGSSPILVMFTFLQASWTRKLKTTLSTRKQRQMIAARKKERE